MSPARLLHVLSSRGIKGVILFHGGDLAAEWPDFCMVELACPYSRFHSVKSDHIEAGRLVIAELKRRGNQRIGWANADAVEENSGYRWRMAIQEYKLSVGAKSRVPPMNGSDYSSGAYLKWLHRYEPEAVVANDLFPMRWVREAGYAISR